MKQGDILYLINERDYAVQTLEVKEYNHNETDSFGLTLVGTIIFYTKLIEELTDGYLTYPTDGTRYKCRSNNVNQEHYTIFTDKQQAIAYSRRLIELCLQNSVEEAEKHRMWYGQCIDKIGVWEKRKADLDKL